VSSHFNVIERLKKYPKIWHETDREQTNGQHMNKHYVTQI